MFDKRRRRSWLPMLLAPLAFACAEPAEFSNSAKETALEAPRARVFLDSNIAEQVVSSQWHERKTAQRLMFGMPADQTAEVAQSLMEAVDTETTPDDLVRLVGMALELDREAATQLTGALFSDESLSAELRIRLAVIVLSSEGDATEALGLARNMVQDRATEPRLRAHALQVFAQLSPAEAWPLIQTWISSDRDQRRAAVGALSKVRFPESVPLLLPLTTDRSGFVRRNAIEALSLFPEDPRVTGALDSILDSADDRRTCSRAIELAEALGSASSVHSLEERFSQESGCGPEHRFAIVATFRRLRRADPTAEHGEDLLRQVLTGEDEPSLKAYAAAALLDLEAATALAEAGAPEGLVMLTSRSQETEETRIAAIRALSLVSDPSGLPLRRLETLLGRVRESPAILNAVLNSLGRIHVGEGQRHAFLAIPYLNEAEDPQLRQSAARYLADHAASLRSAEYLRALALGDNAILAAAGTRGLTRIHGHELSEADLASPDLELPTVERLAEDRDLELPEHDSTNH